MKKLKKFIKPTTVCHIFKKFHLIMKLFGLFPFKLKPTKNGLKPVICFWGLILTIVHFITYYYCFFLVMTKRMHGTGLNVSMYISIVDKFGTQVLLYIDGLTILCIFLSIFLTSKAQSKIFSLFCQAEYRFRDKEFNFGLELFGFTFILFLNLSVICLCSVKFFIEISKFGGDLVYLFARLLPHFYIQLKASQYVLYVIMLQLGFNELNNRMVTK